ncbi:PspC domain-containing protein [Corynebacterium mucifaciens]|uniref:PspC domain-containing protein n=1 Tax=Corynebacterium ureicelerivorans TaxID=401472 RepID=UPI00235232C1|nr:PspC domain-containing protein [Corynebacterium ureicelerivorans]MCT1370418.1 PspC domain-containing protein [Corynebacterium mucifaciens]
MENNTLTQMWETRPPRIPENQGGKAVIGGVCEGIGARFHIDPTFIRVLFVAMSLAFGGGVFLYLLCWINMPRFGLTRSPWSTIITPKKQLTKAEKKDRDTGWLLLLGLFLFFPLASTGDPRAVLVTFVLFAAGWYLAQQRQPEPPAGLLAGGPEETSMSNAPTVGTSHLTVPEGYEHPGQRPPAWDPLGVAPDLWHLPDPVEPKPESARTKQRYWLWIPAALVLTAVALWTMSVLNSLRTGAIGDFGVANVTANSAEAMPEFKHRIGEARIDLSHMKPPEEPTTIELSNGFGKIDLKLPTDVPLVVNCDAKIGRASCPEETQNADADSALLTINVTQRVGSVSAYYAE